MLGNWLVPWKRKSSFASPLLIGAASRARGAVLTDCRSARSRSSPHTQARRRRTDVLVPAALVVAPEAPVLNPLHAHHVRTLALYAQRLRAGHGTDWYTTRVRMPRTAARHDACRRHRQ